MVGPAHRVLRDRDLAADVDRELVDARRDRLLGDGEHGGVHRMGVDHRADVVVRLVAGEVQQLLRRRCLGAVEDVAVEVDDDKVIERHLLVVDRRRGDADGAVVHPRRDVAGGAFDEALGEQLLGGGEHALLHCRTSGLRMYSGRSPASRRARSSAIMPLWLASVSYVAPPM